MRAVVDPNVIISALLCPGGAPATILAEWQHGAFELIVSELLLAELGRAFAYPKLRTRISRDEADQVLEWLRRSAIVAPDPDDPPPVRSPDPGDDYLIALAAAQASHLVSGDGHLLGLEADVPIVAPRRFLELLADV